MNVGALFAGYGGLELAVQGLFGDTRLAWYSEIDKNASKVMAAHWPSPPNLGDITRVDWNTVEPVDILTGGFPCQDVSHAGLRAGIRPGTRSGLWQHMAYAIKQLRPGMVVIENVSGIRSAAAVGDVEPCPWCVGDEPGGHMRALGIVLADLAGLGFDAEWVSVRASDVGAAHRRERVFIVAENTDDRRGQTSARQTGEVGDTQRGVGALRTSGSDRSAATDARGGQLAGTAERPDGLPVTSERSGTADVALLPTPAVNDMGAGKTVEWWDEWAPRQKSSDGRPAPHGKSLAIEAQRLLPTPKASDGPNGGPGMRNGRGEADALPGVVSLLPTPVASDSADRQKSANWDGNDLVSTSKELGTNFGPYTAAIARWETVIGRPAPAPTEPGQNGRPRLSPAFVEWLMGLGQGWVTDTGIPRSAQLKILGNGVVPLQACHAIRVACERLCGVTA